MSLYYARNFVTAVLFCFMISSSITLAHFLRPLSTHLGYPIWDGLLRKAIMQFSISDYQSDGPGFQGQVEVNYSALTRGLVIKAGTYEASYVVPALVPRFVRVVPNAPDVEHQAFVACSGGSGSYEPEEFEEGRIVTLEFVGGLLGYFVLFGEPCYAAMTIGRLRYALQEEEITSF